MSDEHLSKELVRRDRRLSLTGAMVLSGTLLAGAAAGGVIGGTLGSSLQGQDSGNTYVLELPDNPYKGSINIRGNCFPGTAQASCEIRYGNSSRIDVRAPQEPDPDKIPLDDSQCEDLVRADVQQTVPTLSELGIFELAGKKSSETLVTTPYGAVLSDRMNPDAGQRGFHYVCATEVANNISSLATGFEVPVELLKGRRKVPE